VRSVAIVVGVSERDDHEVGEIDADDVRLVGHGVTAPS